MAEIDPDTIFEHKKEEKWTNKQRTLIVSSRGITEKYRHLMLDLVALMPHSKKEAKIEKRDVPNQISELCYIHTCNNFMYFECRKKRDLYLWVGRFPTGPTIKFLLENVHTNEELKMTGNCLKGSRPVLSFDGSFNEKSHWKLARELLIHTFNVPKYHPKSKPCVDHTYSFVISDERIWFRNYQIWTESWNKALENEELYEIGPRFVLNPICILDGVMNGLVLYKNPSYISTTKIQATQKRERTQVKIKKGKKKFKNQQVLNIPTEVDDVDGLFQQQEESD